MEDWDLSEENVLRRTQKCSVYFRFIPALFENVDVKEFEKDALKDISGSVAFNIMVHSQPGILEIFLALYFRPDDHYVIHLDAKVQTFPVHVLLQILFFILFAQKTITTCMLLNCIFRLRK